MMAVDGTTAVLDAIHALAFTKTGGVGNTWPGDSSNFRTLLGAQAPVIAQAVDNILSAEDASFEAGTTGTWSNAINCSIANDATNSWHGTKCLKLTSIADGNTASGNNFTAQSSNAVYTCSLRFKATAGRTIALQLLGNVSGQHITTVVATGGWDTIAETHTFAGDASRMLYFYQLPAVGAGDVARIDAIQLEAGAVATSFALDYRTAPVCSIPTATVGITPGMPISIVCIVNTSWDGLSGAPSDGVPHVLFNLSPSCEVANSIYIIIHADGKFWGAFRDANNVSKSLNTYDITTSWTANANHVVIFTIDAALNETLTFDGTAITHSEGAATTRETALGSVIQVGSFPAGAYQLPLNGSILCAVYGRILTAGEKAVINALATWTNIIDLPQITVTGLATGNAARLYDAAGNVHASAIETGGTATLTYTLD